ncbi:MAG: universal stress protein [Gammaproteobacteria bacterium]
MLKDILVHVDDPEKCAALDTAIGLAQRFNAHLSGLHVTSLFHYVAAKDVYVAGLWEASKDELRAAAQRAKERFAGATARAGINGEWHHVDGDAATVIGDYGRVVDLIVMGQPAENASPVTRDVADKLPLTTGRPVLYVPPGFSGSPGTSILVAWNDSREAARAVNDALPLLVRAEHVIIMAVAAPDGDNEFPCADIAAHLARHGVQAVAARDWASDNRVGDRLLEQAARQKADLIVAGAYGHSRLKEIVLGGVTRHMFRHAPMPVLMSH